MKKLYQARIDEALPQAHDYYLSDHQIIGLCCRILPSGVKTYYYRYTSPLDKKRKKIKIKDAKTLKLDEARIVAKELSLEINKGNDPLLEIKIAVEQKNSITFEEFWPIFYNERIKRKLKESTRNTNKSKFKRIIDFFGKMEIDKIEHQDIINFRDSIKKEHTSVFPISLTYLKTLFDLAEIHKKRANNSNPCMHVESWTSNSKERYLSEEELSKLVELIEYKIKNTRKSIYPYYAILCLIYTGQRKNEIVKLKWEDIDFKQKTVFLADSKVGKRKFYLNDKAICILKQIPKQENNHYVFCGTQNNCTTTVDDVWTKMRIKLDLEDVRIHDLRHSFASFAINKGHDLYSVSKLLGHKNIGTTQRYAHLSNEKLIETNNNIFT